MAGSILSTYMMFLPEKTKWFCLIGLFAAFWLYVQYEERKKKKKQRQKNQPKNPEPVKRASEDKKKLEQLKALKDAGLLSEEEYREKKRGL